VKEKPILFSSEMVRAILDGRKTQTRRVIKPQPLELCDEIWQWKHTEQKEEDLYEWLETAAPYQIGDRLWVRETWRPFCFHYEGESMYTDYRADGARLERMLSEEAYADGWLEREWARWGDAAKAAGIPLDDWDESWPLEQLEQTGFVMPWRPSIFMPKWATRIWLEVTGVRAERVQDISDGDIEAEGVVVNAEFNPVVERYWGFIQLWDSINAKRGLGWATNPWVWVYEFERLETPAGASQ